MVSTTIVEWNVVPDYIGDGSGDHKAIMMAICDGIGEGFDGTDCDGVVTGTPEVGNTASFVCTDFSPPCVNVS